MAPFRALPFRGFWGRIGTVPRFAAFLRALNVGGHHIVKMDELKRHFEKMGFTDVETFIASGNVVFTSKSAKGLDAKIAKALEKELDHPVATFVRPTADLAVLAAHEAFPKAAVAAALSNSVGFLSTELDAAALARLKALETDDDRFHVRGREFWWISKIPQNEAAISGKVLERALGQPTTMRNVNTIRRMAERYSP
jgi:uncharacterized protein (DUF1697 family)